MNLGEKKTHQNSSQGDLMLIGLITQKKVQVLKNCNSLTEKEYSSIPNFP